MTDRLNRAIAELIFGYGAERFAKKAALNPKSLYRTFSLTEKKDIRFETVDYVLRCFGMRLAVVRLGPEEQEIFERTRLRRVAGRVATQVERLQKGARR